MIKGIEVAISYTEAKGITGRKTVTERACFSVYEDEEYNMDERENFKKAISKLITASRRDSIGDMQFDVTPYNADSWKNERLLVRVYRAWDDVEKGTITVLKVPADKYNTQLEKVVMAEAQAKKYIMTVYDEAVKKAMEEYRESVAA